VLEAVITHPQSVRVSPLTTPLSAALLGLFLVACVSLGIDCLHNRCFALTVIITRRERAESERRKEEGL